MKVQLIGAAVLAAALAACGGKASFTVGGSIAGLSNPGLVLQVNGGDTINVPSGATSYSFPNGIDYGTEYTVSIKTQPAHMTCDFATTPTGSAGRTTTINVVLNCVQNDYVLGGSVVNLQGEGLTLVNGSSSGTLPIAKGATEFRLLTEIKVGDAYGLSVLTQPTNPAQQCTIANGTGVMGDADRMNVVVTCVNK